MGIQITSPDVETDEFSITKSGSTIQCVNPTTAIRLYSTTGATKYYSVGGVDQIVNNDYTKIYEFTLGKFFSGNLNTTMSIKANNGGLQVKARIYRNGVAVGTERTATGDSTQTFAEIISGWSAGDKVQLYAKRVSDNGGVLDFSLIGTLTQSTTFDFLNAEDTT